MNIREIKKIDGRQLLPGDIRTIGFDISKGLVCRWWEIVYRASTQEVFKIECWDGMYACYQPDLPHGVLPPDVTITGDFKDTLRHSIVERIFLFPERCPDD